MFRMYLGSLAYWESKSGNLSGNTPRYQNGGARQWAEVSICFLEIRVPPQVAL